MVFITAIAAVMPPLASGQDDDIVISWQHPSYSLHEGDVTGLTVLYSDVVPQSLVDSQVTPPVWYLTVFLSHTDQGGATSNDYSALARSFKMYARDSYQGIGFWADADDVVDPGESVEITFDTSRLPDGVSVDPAKATTVVHILDGPSGPWVTLDLSPDSISENGGVSTVTARLNKTVDQDVTLNVTAAPGTGAAASDFRLSSNTTLTIAEGQLSSTGTVTVTAVNNTVDAPDKTVNVTASVTAGPSNTRGVSTETLTITDSEEAPTVTLVLTPDAISEDGGVSTVTARLDRAAGEDVTLDVGASPGTGTAAADFELSSNTTLTITKGQTGSTGTVTVTAQNNEVFEPDKAVEVSATLSSAPADLEAPTAQTLTIEEDDTEPTKVILSVNPATVDEDDGSTSITVTGTLDGAALTTATEVTVSVGSGTDSATEGTDYTTVEDFTLTIAANQMKGTATFDLAPDDDEIAEDAETVTVDGTVTGLDVDAATVTITDDDAEPTKVILSVNPATVDEDDGATSITVTGTLDGASLTTATEVTVSVGSGTDSATEGTDYTPVEDFTLSIAANQMKGTATFDLAPDDDEIAEGAETVTVDGTVSGLDVDAATVTITDDDAEPTKVILSVNPATVDEDDGSTSITVTGTLDGASLTTATEVTVSVGSGTDSAAEGTDYTPVEDFTLSIAANQMKGTATFDLAPDDDEIAEGAETVTVDGTVTGLDVDAATVTITDDDATPTKVILSVDRATVNEDEGSTQIEVTGTLDGAPLATPTDVTVSVGASSDSATEGTDYTPVDDFTLTIAANQMSGTATFDLEPTDDEASEDAETVTVGGSVTGLDVDPATVTIIDDDASRQRVRLSMSNDSEWIEEDAGPTEVTVKAELTREARDVETRVQVELQPHEASADDYQAEEESFQILIPANQMNGSHTFTFTPVDDDREERDENVMFTGDTGESDLPVDPATLMIKDNDGGGGDEGKDTSDPPSFTTSSYSFDLPEERDGRQDPYRLGVVTARDPNGQALTYTLAAGDGSRFEVGASSGTVTYVGPGEDYENGTRQYELTIGARNRERQTATARVTVTVTDVPEAPAAADDRAETPEDEPAVIDVLANDRDPDGDRIRVTTITAPEHGTASLVSGRIRYAPSLNYHGPDRFRYKVVDPDGMTDTATVEVTVTPVNDAPEAEDDEVETLEDEAIVVDVLANDTDVDGDPLTVVAVTAPGHGETTVAGGGVRYVPSLNYHGLDRFDYTISDPGGLTDTATVILTVLPVNDAPEAVGTIPEQALEEGGESLTLDLAPYFSDVDGDALTYTAESSDPAATTVAVSGSTLTLSAVVRGAATITVTAADPDGLTATQVFGVAVGDRLVRDVLTDLMAALGRGHLSSVRQTVGRRLETAGAETSHLALAGQYFSPLMWNRLGTGGLAQTHEWYFRAAMLQQRRAATELLGTSADPRFRESNGFLGVGSFGGGWDQALLGSNMLLTFGGEDAGANRSGRPRWTVWGQGDLQTFRGTPEPVSGYQGDLRTGYLGVDVQVSGGWLMGVAMARSGGAGIWERGESGGDLSTTLTRVHPYVRWANDDTAIWGVLGVGRGTATHVRTLTGLRETSDLGLGLGLLEGRRRVATVGGGVDVGLRGEASWARLATGNGDETLDDLQAGVRRVRAGVELLRGFSAAGGMTLTPFGAVSTRHDGGAGQTGVGLEVAGGLRVRNGRVRLEAQGRRLLVHSATGYEEQGVSLAAMVGSSPYEPGLTLSVRPTWGAPGMGAETLWQDQFHTYRQGADYDAAGIDARLGYGVELPWGSVLTPFGAYAQREDARRFEVGAVMTELGELPGALDGPIQIELSGERYERPGGKPDHRVGMFGVVNLGGRKPAPETAAGDDSMLDVPGSDPVAVADVRKDAPLLSEPMLGMVPLVELAAPVLADLAVVSEAAVAAAPTLESSPPVGGTGGADASTNGAPVFSAPTYAFQLALPRQGDGGRVPLGAVLARDPDGDPVTYSLTMGDGTRFAVDPSSGTVTYVGEIEELEAGTVRHELTVTARDRGRQTQTATVVVTMESFAGAPPEPAAGAGANERRAAAAAASAATPRPGTGGGTGAERRAGAGAVTAAAPPATTARRAEARRRSAVADAARTYGTVPVLIDVLANDAESRGLRIVAMTAPAHGTATVRNGMVRYVPEQGYRGQDTFTYTVVGQGGLTSRATVTVNVMDAE